MNDFILHRMSHVMGKNAAPHEMQSTKLGSSRCKATSLRHFSAICIVEPGHVNNLKILKLKDGTN